MSRAGCYDGSMTNYRAGTVAKATVRGKQDRMVVRTGEGCWYTPEAVGLWFTHLDSAVTDIRPLVVLDLEAANPQAPTSLVVEHLLVDLRSAGHLGSSAIADQIEEQTKPARIPEPGVYGVVKARGMNLGQVQEWVSLPGHHWVNATGNSRFWDQLDNPVLVREGVDV